MVITNRLIFLGAKNDNLQEFVRLYSLSKKWTHEYWLLDLSVTRNIEETLYLSQNLPLDLDDNLYLFASDGNENGNKIDIWEFYEIHPTRPKKFNYYGSWMSKNGLNITNEEKWDRRNNLEVCVSSHISLIGFDLMFFFTFIGYTICHLDIGYESLHYSIRTKIR